jgi:hypothetical protein
MWELPDAASVRIYRVGGMRSGWLAYDGRPIPSTLAFITKRLYEEKRDAEAKVFQDLQSGRLHAQGRSIRENADELGYSHSLVHKTLVNDESRRVGNAAS